MINNQLKIAFAYISVVIGGGFASGFEIIKFFTSFGIMGIIGTLLALLLFVFMGLRVVKLGARIQANSHKDILFHVFGKQIGFFIDIILTFFLFGVGVVMLAGSGAMMKQLFDVDPFYGSLLMTLLVALTLCMNGKKIIEIIGALSPLLIVTVLIVAVCSLDISSSFHSMDIKAQEYDSAAPHWALSSFLYVAFNISAVLPMLSIIGGKSKNESGVGRGGILGGVGLGLLIIVLNISLFVNIEKLQGIDLPILAIASHISPFLRIMMAIVLVCMIYSTAASMFFSCAIRIAPQDGNNFKRYGIILCCFGFILSFCGFTQLISYMYPLLGYLGMIIMFAICIGWIREKMNFVLADY